MVAGAELAAIDAILADTLCRPAMPRSAGLRGIAAAGAFCTRGHEPGYAWATRNPAIDD